MNTSAPARPGPATALRRDVGLLGLTMASLGMVIGSGWMLGALSAAKIAGAAALLAWPIAGALVVLLALTYAELGAAYPLAGGTAAVPQLALGSLAGFTSGWMSWIYSLALVPLEVEAALTYMTNLRPLSWLTHQVHGVPVVTPAGFAVAAILMVAFASINAMGVRRLAGTNTAATILKLAVPVLTVVVLISVSFHPGNFSAGGGFAPAGVRGIFAALPAGVVFSLLGFEGAVQLAGESRHPARHIPLAVVGSVITGAVVYFALQVAFTGALNPADLLHGWSNPVSKGSFGPYAGIASALGIGWLAATLYVDAFVSPTACGLIYAGAAARISYALGASGHAPARLTATNRRGAPVISILFTAAVGLLLFLPFPSWQTIVAFVTSAAVLMYIFAPLSLAVLRRTDPTRPRPYRLHANGILAPVAFVLASLIFYWSGWNTDWRLLTAAGLGYVLLAVNRWRTPAEQRPPLHPRKAAWLWPYLLGMAVISYLGQFGGGRGAIPFWWDTALVTVFSLACYRLALNLALTATHTQQPPNTDSLPETVGDPAA